MKWLNRVFVLLGIFGLLLSSCEDMLEVDYNGVINEKDHSIDSPNDSIYSVLGIAKAFEALGSRYVILGEARGDLLQLTANASEPIQEVANFEVSSDNPYADVRDYYAVINRCNLYIDRVDTSIVAQNQKVMYKEFAAVKAIRAWTYLQLALNHKEVYYFEEPLLSVGSAEEVEAQPKLEIEELLPELIADLEPVREIPLPGALSLGEDVVNSRKLLLPVRFVLGDLYLYNGEYEKAAQAYYDLMYADRLLLTDRVRAEKVVVDNAFTGGSIYSGFATTSSTELLSMFAGSKAYGSAYELDSVFLYRHELQPSVLATDTWDMQTYYHSPALSTQGDERGVWSVAYYDASRDIMFLSGGENYPFVNSKIDRFNEENTWGVPIYRVGLLYLRYAEAVNRAGKPALAFTVLKTGVSAAVLNNNSMVPEHEKTPLAPYMDFTRDRFNIYSGSTETNTRGVHARGSGNVHNIVAYSIESQPEWTAQDSILYVEDLIVTELALETAFEGNRFHDLMRVAKRRDDPAYLADRVAARTGSTDEQLRSLLMDENTWYLPY